MAAPPTSNIVRSARAVNIHSLVLMERDLCDTLKELQPQMMSKLSPPSQYLDQLLEVAPEGDLKTVRQVEESDGGDAAVSVLLSLLPKWGANGLGWFSGVLTGLGLHEAVRKIEISQTRGNCRVVERTCSGNSLSSSVSQESMGRDGKKQRSISDSTPYVSSARSVASNLQSLPRSRSEPVSLSRAVFMRRNSGLRSRVRIATTGKFVTCTV